MNNEFIFCKLPERRHPPFTHLFSVNQVSGSFTKELAKIPVELEESGKAIGTIRIFHINDIHHNIIDQKNSTISVHNKVTTLYCPLARIGSLIDESRKIGKNVLFFSAGDDHIGSTMDALLSPNREEQPISGIYRIYQEIGLNATVLGNHEFDLPIPVLNRIISDAQFPVLCGNIEIQKKEYHQAIIGRVEGLSIGIIGLTTQDEMHIGVASKEIVIKDPISCAKRLISAISPYCNLIIFLSHLGYRTAGTLNHLSYDDTDLAKAIAPISNLPTIIIGGHTHTVINNEISSIPIFQAGAYAEYVGIIDLSFQDGHMAYQSHMLQVANIESSTNFEQSIVDNCVLPLFNTVNTYMTKKLCTVIGTTEAKTEQTMVDRLCGESAMMNTITDIISSHIPKMFVANQKNLYDLIVMRPEILDRNSTQLPISRIIAACDGASIQGGINDHSSLTIEDLYRIIPYADTIHCAYITGSELLQIIQSNIQRMMKKHDFISFGGTVDTRDWHHILRGYLHFSQPLNYSVRLVKNRYELSDCFYGNIPLTQLSNELFMLFLNSLPALGHLGWNGTYWLKKTRQILFDMRKLQFIDTRILLRDIMIDAMKKETHVAFVKDSRFTLIEPDK